MWRSRGGRCLTSHRSRTFALSAPAPSKTKPILAAAVGIQPGVNRRSKGNPCVAPGLPAPGKNLQDPNGDVENRTCQPPRDLPVSVAGNRTPEKKAVGPWPCVRRAVLLFHADSARPSLLVQWAVHSGCARLAAPGWPAPGCFRIGSWSWEGAFVHEGCPDSDGLA